jgi:hypothetical protein
MSIIIYYITLFKSEIAISVLPLKNKRNSKEIYQATRLKGNLI